MSEDILDDVIKLIRNRTALHDFLSVPAPDILHTNDFVEHNQKRQAENEQDFEFIYKRELKNKNVIDTPETKTIFCKELTSHVQELIELHKKNSSYKEGRDINILTLGNLFIKYLEKVIDLNHTAPSSVNQYPTVSIGSKDVPAITNGSLSESLRVNVDLKGLPGSFCLKYLQPLTEINPRCKKVAIPADSDDFKRLVNYVDEYFQTFVIPENITPVSGLKKNESFQLIYRAFNLMIEEKKLVKPRYPTTLEPFIRKIFYPTFEHLKAGSIVKSISRTK